MFDRLKFTIFAMIFSQIVEILKDLWALCRNEKR